MPELPEVETIRRQLAPALMGREIAAIEVLDARWAEPSSPQQFGAVAAGQRIEALRRRGKYLLIELESGHVLALHLRMTGNLILVGGPGAEDAVAEPRIGSVSQEDAARHLRARIVLEESRELWFTDPRRFGRGIVLGPGEEDAYFASRLGVEPFSPEFGPELIGRLARGRRTPVKSFLLDQRAIAGIGNIYADEALFRARLHPLSPTASTRPEHHSALAEGIVEALESGIVNGGASIDDYLDSRGQAGRMQDEFLVHRREGLPCPGCGEPIRRIVVSGRSTYFCPSCQVRLRRRRRRH